MDFYLAEEIHIFVHPVPKTIGESAAQGKFHPNPHKKQEAGYLCQDVGSDGTMQGSQAFVTSLPPCPVCCSSVNGGGGLAGVAGGIKGFGVHL